MLNVIISPYSTESWSVFVHGRYSAFETSCASKAQGQMGKNLLAFSQHPGQISEKF